MAERCDGADVGTQGLGMPQHFTRSVVSAEFYCGKCQRKTQHRIDDHRKGPCLSCIQKLEILHERYEERAAIMEFDGKLPRDEAERMAKLEVSKR